MRVFEACEDSTFLAQFGDGLHAELRRRLEREIGYCLFNSARAAPKPSSDMFMG
jgi:hypothetical protein